MKTFLDKFKEELQEYFPDYFWDVKYVPFEDSLTAHGKKKNDNAIFCNLDVTKHDGSHYSFIADCYVFNNVKSLNHELERLFESLYKEHEALEFEIARLCRKQREIEDNWI